MDLPPHQVAADPVRPVFRACKDQYLAELIALQKVRQQLGLLKRVDRIDELALPG